MLDRAEPVVLPEVKQDRRREILRRLEDPERGNYQRVAERVYPLLIDPSIDADAFTPRVHELAADLAYFVHLHHGDLCGELQAWLAQKSLDAILGRV